MPGGLMQCSNKRQHLTDAGGSKADVLINAWVSIRSFMVY